MSATKSIRGGLAALVLIGYLTGCATHEAGPPPLLDLTAFQCASTPALLGATRIAYDPKKSENKTTAEITQASLCLKDSVGASLYAAYELPSATTAYFVRVNSEPEGETLLAPRVLLYDSKGTLKREFSGSQIVFRGSVLSVMFRSHEDERYLVVASDPAAVGQKLSQVRDTTQSSVAAAYPFYFSVYTGADTTVKNTLSQNGRVAISLEPIPAR